MTLSLLAFWLSAAVASVSAVVVLFARDAKQAAAASAGVALGASAMASAVAAPAASVICALCGLGASSMLMWSGARTTQGRDWRGVVGRLGIGWRIAFGVAGGLWLWMVAGTMARQYLSYGVDLGSRPDFGNAASVGSMLAQRFGPVVAGICMLAAVAVYALVAHLDEEPGRREDGR